MTKARIHTARVVGIESATKFTDNVERATISFTAADQMSREIRVKNEDGWRLDDILAIQIISINSLEDEPKADAAFTASES